MIRLILFMMQIVLVGFGFFWLWRNPGMAHIQWLGYEIQTSFSFLIIFLIGIMISTALVWNTCKFLILLPWHIGKLWRKRNIKKGFIILYQAFTAIEQNDHSRLMKTVSSLKKLLQEPALSLYLEGILARTQSQLPMAQEKFQALANIPESQELGEICLLKMALDSLDYATAWRIYENLNDRISFSTDILQRVLWGALELYKFDEAQAVIASIKKMKKLTTPEVRALRSQVALHQSRYYKSVLHKEESAYIGAQEAYDLEPSAEAAFELLPYLLNQSKTTQCKEILRKVWQEAPSQKIQFLLGRIEGSDSNLIVYSTLKKWSENLENYPDRYIILAKSALEAKLWGEARLWLDRLPNDAPYLIQKIGLEAQMEISEHKNPEKALTLYRETLQIEPA